MREPDGESTFFASAAAFRDWLAPNAGRHAKLLVGLHNVDSGRPSMSGSESVDEALCVGWTAPGSGRPATAAAGPNPASTGARAVARWAIDNDPLRTMPSFQLVGLSPEPFEPLFRLSTQELAGLGARRVTASSKPGFPCRISLSDAEPGEELLLLAHEHQPAHSPYRASGPIYVRVGARQRTLNAGEIPTYVSMRQISLRAYDESDMIVAAEVCDGVAVAAEIERQFGNPLVRYIHLHNAKRGCFSCLVRRA